MYTELIAQKEKLKNMSREQLMDFIKEHLPKDQHIPEEFPPQLEDISKYCGELIFDFLIILTTTRFIADSGIKNCEQESKLYFKWVITMMIEAYKKKEEDLNKKNS